MFGKAVLRLISYAVAGAVLVLLGSRIVSSVASVVFAWRLGNPAPIAAIIVGTLFLVFFSRGERDNLPRMVIEILAWIAAAYLSVVVFFVVMPFGILPAFFGMGGILMAIGAIKNTKGIGSKLRVFVDRTANSSSGLPLVNRNHGLDGLGLGHLVRGLHLRCYLVPRPQRFRIVDLIKERPLLPVSLTRYSDYDILFVKDDPRIGGQIESLLDGEGISQVSPLSSFLTRILLSLPLLEESRAGVSREDYVFCSEEVTVKRLVDIWPDRVTVFPSVQGPIIVARKNAVPGFETEALPKGREASVILGRDASLLYNGGSELAA